MRLESDSLLLEMTERRCVVRFYFSLGDVYSSESIIFTDFNIPTIEILILAKKDMPILF